jgi:hypothetical protein
MVEFDLQPTTSIKSHIRLTMNTIYFRKPLMTASNYSLNVTSIKEAASVRLDNIHCGWPQIMA